MQRTAFALTILVCIAVGNPALAEDNIHLGKLGIGPYISVRESWSDNIYFTPANELRDRITEFLPGVKLRFPFGEHRIEAEYYALFTRYNTYRGEDTTDHTGRALLDLRSGSHLGLTLTDEYTKNHEERGQSATGFIEIFRKNSSTAGAFYQLAGRSKVRFDYSKTSYSFMTSDFRDRDEALAAGYLYYRFLPKTSVFLEYDRKTVDYILPQNGPGGVSLDNSQNSVLIGLTWEATSISKGTIKAGRTNKDFKSPYVNGLTLWSWELSVDHKFSESTSLKLAGMREPNESNFFGTAYYVTTGASMDFSHRMLSKTDLMLKSSYGKDDFSNARKDTTILAGGGIRYWIKEWFDIGVEYRQRKRNSNFDAANYFEHRATVSANMVF